ncbi:MAG: HAMP domain-containing sensor histidine kinase [Parvularculaceae bacterium]
MRQRLTRIMKRLFNEGAAWEGAEGACVVTLDASARIAAVSKGAAALFARSSGELKGIPFASLFEETDREAVTKAVSGKSEKARMAAALSLPSGEARLVDLSVGAGAEGKTSILMLDTSEAPAASRGAALARSAEDARAQAHERADLLADLSHEMKTPLNAVIGFAEAIENETFGPVENPKYLEYAHHIRASGGHLLDLVTSLLDLSRIEAKRFALQCEMTQIGPIAKECAAMVRLSAEKAGLKLIDDIEDDLPESWIDPRALRQILLNLLSNAVKFTSDGEVVLGAHRKGEEIVLTVTDTGVGMNAIELARLGKRFSDMQADGVRGAKGTGLGLALAFALAELHGGALDLESAPGEGVKATLRLPVRTPQRPRRLESLKKTDAALIQPAPDVLTQLERINAYRRERRASAA